MKCRILYIVGQLGSGGLERQLYLLLQTMDRNRYRPEVVVWNFHEDDTYSSPLQKLGIPLHALPNTVYGSSGKLCAFRRIALKVKPEVIHSYSFYTNVAAWWAARATKTIAVGAVRSDFRYDKSSCGWVLGSLSARWPQIQVFNNRAAAQKAQNSFDVFAPKNILVVRNGVDLQRFAEVALRDDGPTRILGIGSLISIKRWDRLLNAGHVLKNRGFEFGIELVGEGALERSLKEQYQHLGLADRVKITGHSDDIAGLLASSTFLAHTSDVEGCPNVVMEAMACGRAVVATSVGDVPSLVEDGITGFIVRPGDDVALAERLATLITDRDLCRRMGEAGRAKAEREFGLDRLVTQTLAAYRAAGWEQT